ncbi:MAG: MerR family transcriptional regulator [Sphingomicrobium sp.]
MATGDKDPDALLTIGEVSRELGVAQHILRYWETRFSQLRPMQRAGNRRYYRTADVTLVRRIDRLLNHEGYTVRGVQKLLRDKVDVAIPQPESATIESRFMPDPEAGDLPPPSPSLPPAQSPAATAPALDVFGLIAIRNRLAALVDL